MRTLLMLAITALVPGGAARADAAALLQAGAYEVSVRLELPHLEDAGATRTVTICVSTEGAAGTHGLVVLSENNPLTRCPATNARQQGDTLTFDIVCPGGNAAVASARYVLGPDTFQGRIAMKMGGKNMTMTETQSGRRVGTCPAADKPPA